MLDVLCMHHAEYVARDLMLPQKLIPAHRFRVGGVLALGDAVAIVHLLRPVEAKTYGKALCRQKTAPVLIEKRTVCLNTIAFGLIGAGYPSVG